MEYRYPFPPYPTGWYLAVESAALEPGAVLALRRFGRELVVFRTASGVATILDAHCPHMGAHLGYGGTVDGEGLRCPFHAWCFGTDGRCRDVPYATVDRVPPVGLRAWPVHETSGLILVHYSESGAEPAWRMPDLAEWGQPGWLGYETVAWTIRMHVQELAENIPDTAHFHTVHSVSPSPRAEVETEGHVYRQRTIAGDQLVTEQEAFGLGLVWLRSNGTLPVRFLTATTPIDDELVELRLLFLVHEGDDATELSPAGKAVVDAIAENTARDVPIWEHKVYREHPPLVAGDGPIGVLRKWARQFYEA
ncbi:MAG TPA: Rieske 2Fe-2S domain-containing protein [Acidimicrobiia bacterium]|nr:Rieske 2Fe-2S domain-containing protein [Acidimicrobiia bacterium]